MIDPRYEDLPAGAGTLSRLGLVTEARLMTWRLVGQHVAVLAVCRQVDDVRQPPQKAQRARVSSFRRRWLRLPDIRSVSFAMKKRVSRNPVREGASRQSWRGVSWRRSSAFAETVGTDSSVSDGES